jgi:glycosyltransferase involved in cell wall biosynthesis
LVKVSICIPTFACGGNGESYLKTLLDSISIQTYTDVEIIISDHSEDAVLKELCDTYSMNIVHHYNKQNRGSCEANLNNAIKLATGEYIKPMLQDDFFNGKEALEKMMEAMLSSSAGWVAAATLHCTEDLIEVLHHHHPAYLPTSAGEWVKGYNTLGTPSVVLYRNIFEYFNEFLVWLMDVEFYYRMWERVGYPALVYDPCIVTRLRAGGITNTEINPAVVEEDTRYCITKHLSKKNIIEEDFPIIFERAKRLNLL